MLKTIHFFGRTYEQLAKAMYALNTRYRIVRIFRQMVNGLFMGYFEVTGYIKRKPINY